MGGKTVLALLQKGAMIGSSKAWGGGPADDPGAGWGSETLGLICACGRFWEINVVEI